mmetsp:Transcript_34657/g.53046  ORF Transcript_34657/g.53046 Transcript_34657/m.53046 type:complete len:246 (+) Transcript_34657:49-786(+)
MMLKSHIKPKAPSLALLNSSSASHAKLVFGLNAASKAGFASKQTSRRLAAASRVNQIGPMSSMAKSQLSQPSGLGVAPFASLMRNCGVRPFSSDNSDKKNLDKEVASEGEEDAEVPDLSDKERVQLAMKRAEEYIEEQKKRPKPPPPGSPEKMYVLKFNNPILPFSKFPLTKNRYIKKFLKLYEKDKDQISKIIAVHFDSNKNANAQGTVGIEVNVTKKNNIALVESVSDRRYKVHEYDPNTNFV